MPAISDVLKPSRVARAAPDCTSMSDRIQSGLGAAIYSVMAASTVASAPASYANSTPTSLISWSDCSSLYGPGFTCANYSVPIDWSAPAGEQVTLGMSRYQANTSTTTPKQNLFLNYGGPGSITTQTLVLTLSLYSQELMDHFDLSRSPPNALLFRSLLAVSLCAA